MKTLIIDDEPLAHDIILTYVNDVEYIKIVGQCHLATEALSFLRTNEVDLIFLDINIHVSLILNLKMKILRFALQNNHLTQISQIHADFSLTKLFFW
ncbi:MAG: hypothetical protein AB8G11_13495, partial [Saprospiraceae bacterium]